MSGEEGWAAGGRLRIPLRHKQPRCVFSKQHKQSQSTRHIKIVVGHSLATHTPLLMPFSGSTGPVVHPHGLTGSIHIPCDYTM